MRSIIIFATMLLAVPYFTVWSFNLLDNEAVGRAITIIYLLATVSWFLIYHIFFSPKVTEKTLIYKTVSLVIASRIDLSLRFFMLTFLVGLFYMVIIPLSIDVYFMVFGDESYVIEGKRVAGKKNLFIDKIISIDADGKRQIYSLPYSVETLKSSYMYTFLVLPRSRLILSEIKN